MNENIELFYDNDKYIGFSGVIRIKNKDININTKTGLGYDKVICELKDMINYLSNKFNLESFTKEDNKQNIILKILEGIPKFHPHKEMQLSTFLQMRISRKLINETRDANIYKRNATLLNVHNFSYKCECGNITTGSSGAINICSCGARLKKTRKLWSKSNTISLEFDGYTCFFDKQSDIERKFIQLDLDASLIDEKEEIKNIVKLIYYGGFTIKEVAESLEMNKNSVYLKLKELKNNNKIKDLFYGGDANV